MDRSPLTLVNAIGVSVLGTECQSEEKDDEPAPKAKALFDFDGEFEDELSFKVNL